VGKGITLPNPLWAENLEKPDKDKTQKYIQLYLPKEDIVTKMAFYGCPQRYRASDCTSRNPNCKVWFATSSANG
jgi:hypothetical protein